MNHIIKNQDSYFVEGSNLHNVWTFNQQEAARFTDFGAELKKIQMINNENCEVIEL